MRPRRAPAGRPVPNALPQADKRRAAVRPKVARRGPALQPRFGNQVEAHHRRPALLFSHRQLGRPQGRLARGRLASPLATHVRFDAVAPAPAEHAARPRGQAGQAETAPQHALGVHLPRRDARRPGCRAGEESRAHGLRQRGLTARPHPGVFRRVEHGEPRGDLAPNDCRRRHHEDLRQRLVGRRPPRPGHARVDAAVAPEAGGH
mmetsp:Transcript_17193/g.58070  ORF Transcript_17193/g.58070 Transcript_17193/m.58070 type:complete len:205 (-) Transcript_17193:2515-3129(-)